MRSKVNGEKEQHQAENLGYAEEISPETGKSKVVKAAKEPASPMTATCEFSGQEVHAFYSAIRGLYERHQNNANSPRVDLAPFTRELAKIGWYDCTQWDAKGKCTNPSCQWGLHA